MFFLLKKVLNKIDFYSIFFVEVFINCFIPFSENENILNSEFVLKIKTIFENKKRIENLTQKIEKIQNFEDLVILIINFYSTDFTDEKNYNIILGLLCFSYKGLTTPEIKKISTISNKELTNLTKILKIFIIKYKNYHKITNTVFIKAFQKKISSQKDFKKNLHIKISSIFENSLNSLRKLEEQTNNLFSSKDYFSLKQKISSIENFIILYNEKTKYDLFKFWGKLEKKGYDPVHEYNKAFELFVMHYNPSDYDIFFINIQICRFFKELSDFESELTPEFRHPFIKGKIVQDCSNLKKRGNFGNRTCFGENDDFGEYEPTEGSFRKIRVDFSPKSDFVTKSDFFSEYYNTYPLIFQDDEMETNLMILKKNGIKKPIIDYLDEIGILEELKNIKILGEKNLILKKHESINIDIPLNKKKFEEFFLEILKEKNKFRNFVDKSEKEYDFDISDFEEKSKNSENLLILQKTKNKKKKELDFITKKIRNIDLTIKNKKEKKYYYYKRWIWMNFPIICMSKQKFNFSEIITFCYSEEKFFLDFEQDKNLYLKNLEIVHNCKNKKNIIFDENENNLKNSILPKEIFLSRRFSKKSIKSVNFKKRFSTKNLKLPKIQKSQIMQNSSQIKKLYKSKFKKNEKRKNKKISQILITQNNLSQPITNILTKAKFKEDRVFKKNLFDLEINIFRKEKNMNFKEKTEKLDKILEKYSKEEILVLDIKLKEIIHGLNLVDYENEKLRICIKKILFLMKMKII